MQCVFTIRDDLKIKQELKALLDPEFIHYYNISRTILMIKSLKIVTSVLWLLPCLGIAPCYAILEFLFGIPECFTMSGYCTMLCNSELIDL